MPKAKAPNKTPVIPTPRTAKKSSVKSAKKKVSTAPQPIKALYAKYTELGNLQRAIDAVASTKKWTFGEAYTTLKDYGYPLGIAESYWLWVSTGVTIAQVAKLRNVDEMSVKKSLFAAGYVVPKDEMRAQDLATGRYVRTFALSNRLVKLFMAVGMKGLREGLTLVKRSPQTISEEMTEGVAYYPIILSADDLNAIQEIKGERLVADDSAIIRQGLDLLVQTHSSLNEFAPGGWDDQPMERVNRHFAPIEGVNKAVVCHTIPLFLYRRMEEYLTLHPGTESSFVREAIMEADESISQFRVPRPPAKGTRYRFMQPINTVLSDLYRNKLQHLSQFLPNSESAGDIVSACLYRKLEELNALPMNSRIWDAWLVLSEECTLEQAAIKLGYASGVELGEELQAAGFIVVKENRKVPQWFLKSVEGGDTIKEYHPTKGKPAKEYIKHIAQSGDSIEKTAKHFGVGKTTVHYALESVGVVGDLKKQLKNGIIPEIVQYLFEDDIEPLSETLAHEIAQA